MNEISNDHDYAQIGFKLSKQRLFQMLAASECQGVAYYAGAVIALIECGVVDVAFHDRPGEISVELITENTDAKRIIEFFEQLHLNGAVSTAPGRCREGHHSRPRFCRGDRPAT